MSSGTALAALIIITGPTWVVYTNSYLIIQPNEAKALQFLENTLAQLKLRVLDF